MEETKLKVFGTTVRRLKLTLRNTTANEQLLKEQLIDLEARHEEFKEKMQEALNYKENKFLITIGHMDKELEVIKKEKKEVETEAGNEYWEKFHLEEML